MKILEIIEVVNAAMALAKQGIELIERMSRGEKITVEELEKVNAERKAADKRWDDLMEKIKQLILFS